MSKTLPITEKKGNGKEFLSLADEVDLSDEGWDNTTHPERGPLGTGGLRFNSCHVAVHRNRLDSATGLWSTGRVNACDGWGMAGLALTCLPSAEDLAST